MLVAISLANPFAPWIFEVPLSAITVWLAIRFARQSWAAGKLTIGALILISSISMFWQEFYADWGASLLYSPRFHLIPWGPTRWTTSNKPWFMPFAYGWYYTAIFLGMLWILRRFRNRWPNIRRPVAAVLIAFPIFYLWDFAVESVSVALGYWTYQQALGPTLHFGGTQISLVYPLLFYAFYASVALFFLSNEEEGQPPAFERLVTRHARSPLRRELSRAGIWIVVMNALYCGCFVGWLVIIRPMWAK
jgi:hypothetical protein